MRPVFGAALLLVYAFAMWAGADAVVWMPDPIPTFDNDSVPSQITLEDQVTLRAQNVEDLDTKTTFDGCNSEHTLHADNVGGYWLVEQPGVPGFTNLVGLLVTVTAEAWVWSGGGSSDTGAVKSISGIFNFDDGRTGEDPPSGRHDTSGLLGAASSVLLIPDRITTTWYGNCYGDPEHIGTIFRMTVRNQDYPLYSFDGLSLREDIVQVVCDVQYDEELAQQLKDSANTSWTLGYSSYLTDSHIAGPAIDGLFLAGNSLVTLAQVYRIISGGWEAKNPTHAVGREGGILGELSAVHLIRYTRESMNPLFYRVTKDSVTCNHTP